MGDNYCRSACLSARPRMQMLGSWLLLATATVWTGAQTQSVFMEQYF